MNEAKIPLMQETRTGETEWQRILLYNQERYISGQEQIVTVITQLLEQQRAMAAVAAKLSDHLDTLGEQMQASIKASGEFNRAIIKVPVVIVLSGIASWAFYIGRLSENTWLIIMAVATFPYLGDGIMAVATIFGLGRGAGGNAQSSHRGNE